MQDFGPNVKHNHTHLLIRNILLIVISAAITGCTSREYTQASGMGWVDFTITTAGTVPAASPQPAYSLTVTSADGMYSHTWGSLSEYPRFEPYTVGRYHASAISGSLGAEGYGCPCYAGDADYEVIESKYSTVSIDCHLTQALINISIGDRLLAGSPDTKVIVHSSGHGYVTASASDSGPVYLTPGTTYLYVTVEDGMGGKATVAPDFRIDTEAEKLYDITVDMESDDTLLVRCGDTVARMPISARLFQSASPSIEAQGFESGAVFNIIEGFPAKEPIRMVVSAPAGLSSAVLTTVSRSDEFSSECDLLSPPVPLESKGLKVETVGDGSLIVDFTDLLENVGVLKNSYLTFLLQARDRLNRVSPASILRVSIKSVDMTQEGQAIAEVGSDMASIDVALTTPDFDVKDFSVYILDHDGNISHATDIVGFEADTEARTARLRFAIDRGFEDIPVRIDFMGNPKLYAIVERVIPHYDIFVDAFALGANIYITAEDEALREIIVRNATPTANGAIATVTDRDVDLGCISIAHLSPASTYEISTVLIPGKYAPAERITTEKTEQVPSGDFEDFEDLLNYKRLACGGAYSNTVFPIFNMQNFSTIDVKWPQKHWAGTNAKTFCRDAKVHNTWYIYPSCMLDFSMSASGSKSMMMQSVGWSLDGQEIEPYKQNGETQLQYNANVPEVAHRSAGKVFLGSYKFDPATMSETYDQGVAFSSRPRSLNGFYQYVSDIATPDYGLVVVELLNDAGPEPVTVGSASMRFSASAGLRSFNLPIDYRTIGIKATKLRIMFSSSYRQGDMQEEDAEVPATADPSKGMFIGSTLRVDNLSFSY